MNNDIKCYSQGRYIDFNNELLISGERKFLITDLNIITKILSLEEIDTDFGAKEFKRSVEFFFEDQSSLVIKDMQNKLPNLLI